MAPLEHTWHLGQSWPLTAEQAPTVSAGADPSSVGAEPNYRLVSCSNCHIGYEQAQECGAKCVKRTIPVGRNHPCPCGSGSKYKHCHGRGQR